MVEASASHEFQQVYITFKNRHFTTLRVMVGHNTNEGLGFAPPVATEAPFNDLIRLTYPSADDSIVEYITSQLYPPIFNGSMPYTDQTSRAAFAVNESMFTCKAAALGRAYNQSYGFVIDVAPALHGSEAPFIYYDPTDDSTNVTLAHSLQDYIINFVIQGAPSSTVDGLSSFPQYGSDGAVVIFNATSIKEGNDPAANERCTWWQLGLYR